MIDVKVKILLIGVAFGIIISVIVHIFTFIDINFVLINKSVWSLHIGAIIVSILTFYLLMKKINTDRKNKKLSDTIKGIFSKRTIFYCSLAGIYAIFNMIYIKNNYSPTVEGRYLIRMFSGHWILFYTICYLVLLKIKRID